MNTTPSRSLIRRRSLIVASTAAIGGLGWLIFEDRKEDLARAAPYVLIREKWTAEHLYNFLSALPASSMLDLKKSLGILKTDAGKDKLSGHEQDAKDIQKHALKVSTNVLFRPFSDESKIPYHDVVKWVSKGTGVASPTVEFAPTFALELELHKRLFAKLWDKLTPEQRRELLAKIDPNQEIKDKAAIAALSGAGALTVLSTTVAFAGFAFYTTMSMTIAAVASAAGIVLPFAAYAGASAIVGILSGPIGWALIGTAAIGGVALAGRADLTGAAKMISHIHNLKVESLRAAGVPEREIFAI